MITVTAPKGERSAKNLNDISKKYSGARPDETVRILKAKGEGGG